MAKEYKNQWVYSNVTDPIMDTDISDSYLAGFEAAEKIAISSLCRVFNDDIASNIVFKALNKKEVE